MPEAVNDPITVMLWGITPERLQQWAQDGDGVELRGSAAAPGVVEGPARVVKSVDQIGEVRDGEILVCGSTSPAWAPIFSRIVATVTDIGGVMSHAAIVCREYGLPAVVGTGRATGADQDRPAHARDGSTARDISTATVVTGGLLHSARARRPAGRRRRPTFGGKSANLGELLGGRASTCPDGLRDRGRRPVRTPPRSPPPTSALGRTTAVAVRSSAVGEDSAEATFAGQQETYLWVRGADAVLRRGARLLGEPRTASARSRTASGWAAGTPEMGVTVQLMVDADVSGVMFTCNPVSGDPSTVAINASWGLGLAVVGGEVTPDEYLRQQGHRRGACASTVGAKHVEYRRRGRRGTGASRGAAERQGVPCLDDAQLGRAAGRRASASQRHFGSHQDVEWAIARDGELFVLQSRPVTATPRGEAAGAGDGAVDGDGHVRRAAERT